MYKVTGKMLTEEQIKEKVYELGKKIEEDFKGEDLLVVGILKGACICFRFNKMYRFGCKYRFYECYKLWKLNRVFWNS